MTSERTQIQQYIDKGYIHWCRTSLDAPRPEHIRGKFCRVPVRVFGTAWWGWSIKRERDRFAVTHRATNIDPDVVAELAR